MITRYHIEVLILSSFINQNMTNDLDIIEYADYKLPYELFSATRTNKLVAKAIYNFQCENKPIDDVLIHDYIKSKTDINEEEYLYVSTVLWVTFDTMLKYLDMLKEIDKKEKLMDRLKALR